MGETYRNSYPLNGRGSPTLITLPRTVATATNNWYLRPHYDLCQLQSTAATIDTFRPTQAHYIRVTTPGTYRQRPGTPKYIVYKGKPSPETLVLTTLSRSIPAVSIPHACEEASPSAHVQRPVHTHASIKRLPYTSTKQCLPPPRQSLPALTFPPITCIED